MKSGGMRLPLPHSLLFQLLSTTASKNGAAVTAPTPAARKKNLAPETRKAPGALLILITFLLLQPTRVLRKKV